MFVLERSMEASEVTLCFRATSVLPESGSKNVVLDRANMSDEALYPMGTWASASSNMACEFAPP